jgi:hypothetical protein
VTIVFVQLADPVGSGVVSGLAHPGGNITGFANYEYSFGASGLRAHSLPNLWHDCRCPSAGHNDVGREREQFRSVVAQARRIAGGPADIDLQVMADGPSRLLQPLHERDEAKFSLRSRMALKRRKGILEAFRVSSDLHFWSQ